MVLCGNGISMPSLSNRFLILSNKSQLNTKPSGESFAQAQVRKLTELSPSPSEHFLFHDFFCKINIAIIANADVNKLANLLIREV